MATVLDFNLKGLLATWPTFGHSVPALLEAAGVPAAALDTPSGEVPVAAVRALWTTAARLDGRPAFGLHVARSLPIGLYQLLEFLAANSPTIGDAVGQVAAHMELVSTAVTLRIQRDGQGATVQVVDRAPEPLLCPPILDYSLGLIVYRGRFALAHPLPVQVTYGWPDPRDGADRAALLGAPVTFGGAAHALRFDAATWQHPIPGHSPQLQAAAEAHAHRLLAPRRSLRGALAEALRGAMGQGQVALGAVARRMGLSGRTLQRRLADEGTTFARELARVRQSEAERLLATTDLPLVEIASRLAFAEQSAFQRAFRRWTGATPAAWRDQRRGG